METIGFVGGGNMAEALIKGIIQAQIFKPENIFISDIRSERLKFLTEQYNVNPCKSNDEIAGKVGVLVLSVKPQNMPDALKSISGAVRPDTLVISIAAGIKIGVISAALGDIAIVRVMPNTPALVGQGASALFANEKAKTILRKVITIFSSVGRAVTVDDEGLLDVVTAVSGNGPAYYFLLTEELIKSAVRLGLPEDIAGDLVLQTAKGAALLAVEAKGRGESLSELRRKVTSPGGTTESALKVFAEGKFGPLVETALKRACQRSRELSTGGG